MTTEKLKALNDLQFRIDELVRIITNAKNQKCEWIQFTFGNGSSCPSVCNDVEIIEKVRTLLIEENEAKLLKLQTEFQSL